MGIRTPDLLHAMQIQPIAGHGWKWPYQQLQSPHVAHDGPLAPLACSPSCSPPACLPPFRQLLVTQHVYGIPGEREPVLYLRSAADGDMTATYLDAFERV